MSAEGELRRRVRRLCWLAGGQVRFGRRLGLHQSVVSRYLNGTRLTPGMARGLWIAYPEMRERVETVLFAARDMGNPDDDSASARSDEEEPSLSIPA